jgi:hypothetical protein
MEVARQYGVPRDVSPIDALTGELHRTQGRVDFLDREMAARPNDPNLLAVYVAERSHLAKLADAMVRNRVAERQAVVGEQTLDVLETALNGIVRDLGRDPSDSYVRAVIARHVRALANPASTVASTFAQNEPMTITAEVVSDDALPEPVAF